MKTAARLLLTGNEPLKLKIKLNQTKLRGARLDHCFSADNMTDTRRILLLGKTGSGKSSLANTIFGERLFTVGDSPNSETRECQSETRTVRGRSICLIDTPGFFDNNPNSTRQSEVILKCMQACDPGPHAFLLVLKVERYTAQEEAVVNIILKYFSEEALKYTTVVFTHGNDLPEGMTILDWVRQNERLSELVQRCGDRCHVFDNTHWNISWFWKLLRFTSNEKQVVQLLNTIDQTVKQNRGMYYTISYMETIKNNKERFREAPEEVQLLLFLDVGEVAALTFSKIPWDVIKEMVIANATKQESRWQWNKSPTMNPEIMQAIDYLSNLYNLYTFSKTAFEQVRPVASNCTVM